ncbi:MAG TPA: heme exporter protein CcmD [Pelagibacterales bacterium]|nr:heme exporter protein CcmD [Pelagibacterales bacterium]HIC42556.1 heme exporter protein CcmD [Pelagibacterales bacterium]
MYFWYVFLSYAICFVLLLILILHSYLKLKKNK